MGREDELSRFTVSLHFDRRLYRQDIAGSIAHVRMLARQGIVTDPEALDIVRGLGEIREEIEEGRFPWREELEDIHMNIESRLFDKIGDLAGKLHTGRSRNDQVAVDVRLYVKEELSEITDAVHGLRSALVEQAEAHPRVVMPGYTHMQRAQPVLFAHHLLAYFEMLGRDDRRFRQAYESADVLPLGSGALAGVPYPIDRESVAEELGFSATSSNSMDAVSDRDFLLDLHSALAVCMMHVSRLAEELVLWSSSEFGFVRMDDRFTTGSSIMPQKRNPDFAEIARGKSGRAYGNLMALLTVLKGLPLTYNRDMQEDKEGLFDTVDSVRETLRVMAGVVSTMQIDARRMEEAARGSYSLATDIADYLVAKGITFREAHGIVSRLSTHAAEHGKAFDELSLDVYRRFSDRFDEDVREISVESSIAARDVRGGTGFERVRRAISDARAQLEGERAG